jgi:hypothetical protein
MIATASGAMLAGLAEAEPRRIRFGRSGCIEQHDDGTFAVFVRGELLGVYSGDDVASRDVFIAVVMDQAERDRGEVALSSLRPALDAAAIALALGEGCVEEGATTWRCGWRRESPLPHHVLGDGRHRDLDAELGELVTDARSAPRHVRLRHLADQSDELAAQRKPTHAAGPTPASP